MKAIYSSFLLLLMLMTVRVYANTSTAELDTLLSSFKSMSANFKQTAVGKKNTGKSSSGTMALQRPGKFRWEIISPSHQLIIADGKYLWIYDVELEQATRQSLSKDAHSPAILLSGSTSALEERFTIIQSRTEGNKKIFQLQPKNSQDMIKRIELQFINEKLNQMSVIDNLGQKNNFYFTNVKVNPALADSLFHFIPPKGVDVIKN